MTARPKLPLVAWRSTSVKASVLIHIHEMRVKRPSDEKIYQLHFK